MTDPSLRQMLAQTLEDYRLSRNERRALRESLQELIRDDSSRRECHQTAFELAQRTIDPMNSSAVLEWLEDVSQVIRQASEPETTETDVEVMFSPADHCWQRIVGLLKSARQSVDICVFTITDDRITSAILEAHVRRVAVRVITDNEKAFDKGSDVERLARSGVDVCVDRTPHHMHHKFAIFDRQRLLTGSYNWTRSAAENNEENYIIVDDTRLRTKFQDEFDRLWNEYSTF
ncbi:MAG: phospholipase D-like domain-containing protein [Planctomycetota bacterium]|nr:phospholipase D-like domain-containing protein [Planctomycetota bacterium]